MVHSKSRYNKGGHLSTKSKLLTQQRMIVMLYHVSKTRKNADMQNYTIAHLAKTA